MLRGSSALLLALTLPLASSITLGSKRAFQSIDSTGATEAVLATDAKPKPVELYSFDDFVRDFKRQYKADSKEYKMRQDLFEKNKKSVLDHQKKTDKKYAKGINKFSDWTPAEYKKLMGYKPSKKIAKQSFFEKEPEATTDGSHPLEHSLDLNVVLPKEHDNTHKLNFANQYVRDQGACGSCWAVSSASVLEAHLEMNEKVLAQVQPKKFEDIALSAQALTSCVENLNQCGGNGGCEGATAELAFQLVQDKGIPYGMDYMYTSGRGMSGTCDAKKMADSKITIGGFVKLPENSYHHLMHALYQAGPVVVSVAANDWGAYVHGIFESDTPDFVINHAVSCMGFGEQEDTKYWLIKNSWGPDWGEKGHIRMLRTDEEDKHCGWDERPEEGTGCKGGPEKVWVCGHSGMLYDSSYPVDVKMKE